MSPTRREALAQLAALVALPLPAGGAPADPLDGTVADYQAGCRRGDWTAAEATARALARCRSDGARWRAIDALAAGAAAEARAADARRRAGRPRGPLDGVPVFAKSIHDLAGLPTTASSAEWARLFPERVRRDALEVARLRAAGAIVLGKTAADDFAYRGNGTSSHTGQVRNPYDPTGTRTPGGSSAGSAVAVAGGMAFAALGTDDGGSNRIPAQFTGVVGMKPSFGSCRAPASCPPGRTSTPTGRWRARWPTPRCCWPRSPAPTRRTRCRRRRARATPPPRCATMRSPACGSGWWRRTCRARRWPPTR
jgi:aspartyl-tRNA(Asn)/glutamyl-tRNA(Gln) amidotransferase subunit A